MKKVKLPHDLSMMIKIKNHQQSIDRQRIENQIWRSKKRFEDLGTVTPMFSPGMKGSVDKVGCLPINGGESPKINNKKVSEDMNTDYKTQPSRLMLSSQMRGRGSKNYGSRISGIDELKRKSIEHEKLAEFQHSNAFRESLESLKNIQTRELKVPRTTFPGSRKQSKQVTRNLKSASYQMDKKNKRNNTQVNSQKYLDAQIVFGADSPKSNKIENQLTKIK